MSDPPPTADDLGRGGAAIRELQVAVKYMGEALERNTEAREKQDGAMIDARAEGTAERALLIAEMRVLSRDNVASNVRDNERFNASEKAEAEWVRTIDESGISTNEFQLECTPGYYNNEGKPGEGPGWFGGTYGGGAIAFFDLLRDWREKGDLQGLELE